MRVVDLKEKTDCTKDIYTNTTTVVPLVATLKMQSILELIEIKLISKHNNT